MRRIICMAAAVALAVGLACYAQADPTADRSGKFTIEIAPGWTQTSGQDLFNLTAADKIGQISISAEAAPKGLTLAIFQTLYVPQAKKALKGFSLVTHGKTTIDGTAAGVWVYTAVIDGVKLEFKNCVAFKNGMMYNIVFATLPQLYKQDVAGLDKAISSWKWL